MRILVPLMWLIVLISFVSCATVKVDADIPPLPKLEAVPVPKLEKVPEGKPQSEREAILERNFIKLGLWAEMVIMGNI